MEILPPDSAVNKPCMGLTAGIRTMIRQSFLFSGLTAAGPGLA